MSRNIWLGDGFTLKSPATALQILVFPTPAPILLAPILFSLIASITVAVYFCSPLWCCCCWNKGPDRKGLLQLSSFRKTSFELFFDFTGSVKLPLNPCQKRFSSLGCNNSAFFFYMLFAYWGQHMLKRMLYLRWYEIVLPVWFSNQMVCFSWNSSTLTIFWIRDSPRRGPFCVFFPESHR